MSKIKVAIVGLGNCASGLIQGVEYYKHNPEVEKKGLLFEEIGGYKLDDVEFVTAFDISKLKVGKSIKEACFADPNMVDWYKEFTNDNKVNLGPKLDGVGEFVEKVFDPMDDDRDPGTVMEQVCDQLRRSEATVLINYLPVGSDMATKFWAEVCLRTKTAMVNAMPSFIASDVEWEAKFKEAGVPIIGDDVKGQVGATIVHRVLTKLLDMRGVKMDTTYQLNVGGNTDFLNMKEIERLKSKKISKTESVTSQMSHKLPDDKVYIGPSDFIPHLGNTKLAFIQLKGDLFMGKPFTIDVRLEVNDKANSAGVIVDCLRFAQLAVDKGLSGFQDVSTFYMKHPLVQKTDPEAYEIVKEAAKG